MSHPGSYEGDLQMTINELIEKAGLLAHIGYWRATWSRHDLDWVEPSFDHPKFISAREAVSLIGDGKVCFTSGMAGNGRCSIFYWGIRERFLRTGHPRDLTWISVGAQGSRGKVPGTAEELALPGLVTMYIAGHLETLKANLALAEQGHCELHNLPQGQMGRILMAQAQGDDFVLSTVGLRTYLDPAYGHGTLVANTGTGNFVEREGDLLRYRLPKVEVAMFNAPYADREGNIYMRHAATLTEVRESALAARRNRGLVMAAVADIVEKDEKSIFLRADQVDRIVVNPYNEQTGSIMQRKYWPMFTTESKMKAVDAVAQLKFINETVKITPDRGPVESALARLGARTFTRLSHEGAYVNIGVGLPEEVSRLIFSAGMTDDVTFLTETGVVGGLPTPGIFFGAAVNPKRMVSSVEVFELCKRELDTTILGLLEVDSDGNVNVSKRGEGPRNYVGCGGLPDLTDSARNILFVGSWMANARMSIDGGRLRIDKPGAMKFKERVDEVTFSGQQALEQGKNVWYATNVGLFHLTHKGMELVEIMPGIDLHRDILDVCRMKIVVPTGDLPIVGDDVLTGNGFHLSWKGRV